MLLMPSQSPQSVTDTTPRPAYLVEEHPQPQHTRTAPCLLGLCFAECCVPPCLHPLPGDVLPPNLTHLELDADKRDLGGLLVGPLAAPTVSPILPLKQLQVCDTLQHADCRSHYDSV